MINWDMVRKNRMVAKRGTDNDKDVPKTLAPLWRKPFEPPVSKANLREEAKGAWIDWHAQHLTPSSSIAALTPSSSA